MTMNNTPDLPADEPGVWLSALADGDARAVEKACSQWRDDAQARKTWHAYHLIGDVMRSEELARPAAGDAAFLAGIRARLAAEPVVLAPIPVVVPARRRQAWLLPMTAVAGFVMVAGVLVLARVGGPGTVAADAALASASGAAGALQVAADNDGVVRDVHLQALMRAHQFARGGVAVAAPGGALRRVEMTVPVSTGR
jgi:sigma-E factor negative regulatory protein RseA